MSVLNSDIKIVRGFVYLSSFLSINSVRSTNIINYSKGRFISCVPVTGINAKC